jgi:hypothetical protein
MKVANRKRSYRRVAIALLLSSATIGAAFLAQPTNALGIKPTSPKSASGAGDRLSAQAKKDDVTVCEELKPCVGDKLESIDTTLRDISSLVSSIAFADPLPLGTFKNKDKNCQRDTHNAFYDNTYPGAAAEKVTFFIKNSGTCPVEISVSATEGGANVGATHDVAANNNGGQGARTGFNVPGGTFLRAKCKDSGTCNYVIDNVRP